MMKPRLLSPSRTERAIFANKGKIFLLKVPDIPPFELSAIAPLYSVKNLKSCSQGCFICQIIA